MMSAMDARASSALSGGIAEQVVKLVTPTFDTLPAGEQAGMVEQAGAVIRKAAHAAEYGIMGVFALLFFFTFGKKAGTQAMIALILCAGYAVTDELHQMFSAGRSCQAADMLIDTAGTAVGIAAAWGIWMWKKKAKLIN